MIGPGPVRDWPYSAVPRLSGLALSRSVQLDGHKEGRRRMLQDVMPESTIVYQLPPLLWSSSLGGGKLFIHHHQGFTREGWGALAI